MNDVKLCSYNPRTGRVIEGNITVTNEDWFDNWLDHMVKTNPELIFFFTKATTDIWDEEKIVSQIPIESTNSRTIKLDDVLTYIWQQPGVNGKSFWIDPREISVMVRTTEDFKLKPDKPEGDDPRAGHPIETEL